MQHRNQLFPLFPHVVGMTNIEREFTEEEYNSVSENALHVVHSLGNNQSKNSFVLERQELKSIKNFCLQSIEFYWKDILKASENVKPIITQSWLNYTNKGESHHKHSHPNSLLSGVFYFSAENDVIRFHSPTRSQLEVKPTEYTMLNSLSYGINVKNGDCAIFPSYLEHDVPESNGDHTRISIAFNVFPEGILGDLENLTYSNVKVEK